MAGHKEQIKQFASIGVGSGLQIDESTGMVRGLNLVEWHSKDGFTYSDEAIQQFADTAKGKMISTTHAGLETTKTIGIITRGYVDPASGPGRRRAKADVEFFTDDPNYKKNVQLMKRAPDKLGLSVDAMVSFDKPSGSPGRQVQRVKRFDFVAFGFNPLSVEHLHQNGTPFEDDDMPIITAADAAKVYVAHKSLFDEHLSQNDEYKSIVEKAAKWDAQQKIAERLPLAKAKCEEFGVPYVESIAQNTVQHDDWEERIKQSADYLKAVGSPVRPKMAPPAHVQTKEQFVRAATLFNSTGASKDESPADFMKSNVN